MLCVLYGAGRFTIDFFRYYEDSPVVGKLLTVSQVMSLALIAVGIIMLRRLSVRARKAKGAAA
jgi:prolipoprotein diacylglyceryltransferase